MQVKMIEGYHLTATNKRHIAEMIAQGMESGKTAKARYTVTKENENFRVIIAEVETSMTGKKFIREWKYLICVKH